MLEKIKNFRLSIEHEWLGGVCAGIAYQLKIPVWIVRLIYFILLTSSYVDEYFGSFFFSLYILLWIFVPNYETEPKDFKEVTNS